MASAKNWEEKTDVKYENHEDMVRGSQFTSVLVRDDKNYSWTDYVSVDDAQLGKRLGKETKAGRARSLDSERKRDEKGPE